MSDAQQEILRRARLLALDVDGTLTDGRLFYDERGDTLAFHVHDGIALEWLMREGVHVAWFTGRDSHAVRVRAAHLGVRELFQKVPDKALALHGLQERLGLGPEHTVAMGDDLPDLGLASRAAFFAAPSDARPEVKARADLVAIARGGAGAVRELVEHILRARGAWDVLVARLAQGTPP